MTRVTTVITSEQFRIWRAVWNDYNGLVGYAVYTEWTTYRYEFLSLTQ